MENKENTIVIHQEIPPKKIMSYNQRMCTRVPSCSTESIEKREYKRLVTSNVYDERLQRMLPKSEFKTIDRHEEMKHYRVSDFALENLISVGKELTPVSLDPSPFDVLNNVPSEE